MNQVHYKQFETKATSIDEENYTITFKVSDSSVDRQGEIVSQKDWLMDNYMANPVLLFGHDPSRPEYVIGQCIKMEYDVSGDCHYGTFKLDAGFNETALLIWNQLVAGTLRTVSLGFITHDYEMQDDIPVLSGVEPVETSIVPIPANAGALAKAYKAGKLEEKDALYLMKSMREEADRIDAQLKVAKPTNKEKALTDEQFAALTGGISKLAEQVTSVTEKVDTLTTENQTLKDEIATLKPAVETAEEKTAREAKESEDKAAADKAEADKKLADEEAAKVEAEKQAAEAEAKRIEEEKVKDDLAKSGSNDQGGAKETDELDENAELTPELQEKIDAELALAA